MAQQQRRRQRTNEALKRVPGSKGGPVTSNRTGEDPYGERKVATKKPSKTRAHGADPHAEEKVSTKESADKFQRMLEYLVNEDRAKAEELFHEIVVAKSRSIYENLLEDEEVDEDDEEVDEDDELDEDDEDLDEDDELDEWDELDEYETTPYQDANDNDQDYQSGHEGSTPGGVDYSWTGGQGTNEVQFGDHGTSVSIPTEDGEFGEATADNPEVAAIFSQHLAGVGADDDAIEAIEAAIDEVDQSVDLASDNEGMYDEADDDLEMGGDPEGDLSMDMGDDDMDDMDAGDEGGEVTQDQIADLEAELADLKAEFEELMADGEGGDDDMDDMGDDDMGDDDMEEPADDMGDEMGDEEMPEENFQYEQVSNEPKSAAQQMREYVNKIGGEHYHQYTGKLGDDGAYTKSPVAGKNDMGGTTANILNAGTSKETNTIGKGGQVQGNGHLSQSPKDMNTGNVNVPGASAAKSFYKNNPKGHGAEKKGSMSSEDGGVNKQSPLNGAPKRAK